MQTNWGDEYQKLNSFFQHVGISYLVCCPHADQQNGPAERKHRHIVEVGLSLLAYASMPLKYWVETFLTAVYLINCLPGKVIQSKTPMERLFGNSVIILFYASSDVLVGQIFDPKIDTSWILVQTMCVPRL
jgi:histone deacetylase 1/2